MSYPTYLCAGKTTTGDSSVIDIKAAYQERLPPVLHVHVTGAANYTVKGSHDNQKWIPYFTGTADSAKDLVVGVRFWKLTVNSVSGSVDASVGEVPDKDGNYVGPAIVPPGTIPA